MSRTVRPYAGLSFDETSGEDDAAPVRGHSMALLPVTDILLNSDNTRTEYAAAPSALARQSASGLLSSLAQGAGGNSTAADEVAFISAVNANGTLALDSFGAWNDGTIPADYSGGYTYALKWGGKTAGTAGGTVSYYFDPSSNWTATEQNWLASGLALWSAIANISFVQTTDAATAGITFKRASDGGANTSTKVTGSSNAGITGGTELWTMTGATISIDTSAAGFGPINGDFSQYGGYPFMTFLHEEGHAIGLGHAGPYNGDVETATQQYSAYDTTLWSIMSYIDPRDKSAAYYASYPVQNTNWGKSGGYSEVPTTWMPLDILAVQRLYGLPTTTPLSGGQTFGFNCNVTGAIEPFFDFTKNTKPVITLWDLGTGNTLDLSGFFTADIVSLVAGTYSSIDGMINNIAIAFGTAIDTLVCGSGNTTVTCNNNGDTVYGNSGKDTIIGGTASDILSGGSGNDTLNGGSGIDTAVYSGARSAYTITRAGLTTTVSGPDGTDTLTGIEKLKFSNVTQSVPTASTDANGDGNSDIYWQNDSGLAAIWTMNGFAQLGGSPVGDPGVTWHMVGSGDFNGDGTADILWQSDNGQADIWTMNGFTLLSGSYVGGNPGTSWHIKGSGDFNGDGTADILWQNDSGQAAIWTINGFTQLGGSQVGINPGADWHVMGTGDFNGDGKSDILWQNDNGQAAIWLMDGFNVLSGSTVGGNPGTSWHAIGAGDFDGDGKSDILWQNDSGQAAIWTMDGLTQTGGSPVGGNPGPSWNVIGTGDFNGDGCADILWQNTNGQAAIWTMQGFTQLGGSTVGGNPGTTWHVVT